MTIKLNCGWFNYLVLFSDGTSKTGITEDLFYRLQDFYQEAKRHNLSIVGFYVTKPVLNKKDALKIEKRFCDKYKSDAIDGHREWFKKDVSWASKSFQKKFNTWHDSKTEFKMMTYDLRDIWNDSLRTPVEKIRNLAPIKAANLKNFSALLQHISEIINSKEKVKICANRETRTGLMILCGILS